MHIEGPKSREYEILSLAEQDASEWPARFILLPFMRSRSIDESVYCLPLMMGNCFIFKNQAYIYFKERMLMQLDYAVRVMSLRPFDHLLSSPLY